MGEARYRNGVRLADLGRTETFAAASDPDGREWIARLPSSIESLCRQWDLVLDSDCVFHGYRAVVLLVRQREDPLALKITSPTGSMTDEARALEAWNGRGMVQMVAVDEAAGAMLLERLDPDRTLLSLGPREAAGIAGAVLRHLAIPAPAGFRSIRTTIGETGQSLVERHERLGHPLPAAWVHRATEIARYLQAHADTRVLIHTDLHYGNILAGRREPWLAIDPRAAAGEPEASVPELMWTRDDYMESDESIRQMLSALSSAASLDEERARRWVIVRCVDYLLWGLEHGLTHDPARCRRILGAVA